MFKILVVGFFVCLGCLTAEAAGNLLPNSVDGLSVDRMTATVGGTPTPLLTTLFGSVPCNASRPTAFSENRQPDFYVCPNYSAAQVNAVLASASTVPGAYVHVVGSTLPVSRAAAGVYDGSNPTGSCFGEPYGLLLANSKDLTLDFSGATLTNQGTDVANYFHSLCLDANTRLTVKNATLDYTHLPFTQGTVTAVSLTSGAQSVTFTLDTSEGFTPSFTSVQRIEKFSTDPSHYGDWLGMVFNNDPSTLNLPISCAAGACTITNSNTGQLMTGISIGDHILAESRIYDADAVRLVRNAGVTFDNVKVFSAPGMGFKAYGWAAGQVAQRDITFRNGSGVESKPGTMRAQSTNADCVHMQGVRGKFTFTDGVLEGCRDDAINIYDFHSTITTVTGTTLGISSARPWAIGDTLRVVSPAGAIRGTMTLSSVTPSGGPFDPATVAVSALPVGTAVNDRIEDVTGASDVIVTGSRIGHSRGHGILANGRRELIEGNFFHDMQNVSAIAIRMMTSTFDQSVYPDQIDILHNIFDNVNMPSLGGVNSSGGLDAGAILIDVMGANGVETTPCQLFNVHIEGNTITGTAAAGIYASGVCGGRIAGNYIASWGQFPSNRSGTFAGPSNAAVALGYGSTSLRVGPNTFVGTSGPYVGGVTSTTRSAIGYQYEPTPLDDSVTWSGSANLNYTAAQGATSLTVLTTTPGATITNTFSLALPNNPSDWDTFRVTANFNLAGGNLTVSSPDRSVGASQTTNTGLTASQSTWRFQASDGAWHRLN